MNLFAWIDKKLGKPDVKDSHWTNLELHKALYRNGIIIEKAKRDRRTLNYEERQIIYAVRSMAVFAGLNDRLINMTEMDGERDRDLVEEPIKVKVKFAYYESAYYGHPAEASYHVIESNHPVILLHGNFGKETLEKHGIRVPKTPTFEQWDRKGRPCFRG